MSSPSKASSLRRFPGQAFASQRRNKPIWILGLLLSLPVFTAAGQQPLERSNAQVVQPNHQVVTIPDHVLYHQFFRHLLYLDRQAASQQFKTADTVEPLNSYQRRLRFSADAFSKVRSSAALTEKQVDAVDAQAKKIIDAVRAQNKLLTGSGQPLPPLPSELAQLQQQRNALIQNQVAMLKADLGSQEAATLDGFLRMQFAPHVKIAIIGATRKHNPVLNPIPPFEGSR